MKQKTEWIGLRRYATIIGDVILFNLSVLLAFYVRFGRSVPDRNFYTYQHSAIAISVGFLAVNFLLGVYVFYNRRISDILFNTILGQFLTTW